MLGVVYKKYLVPNPGKKSSLPSCSSSTEMHHPDGTVVINSTFFSVHCVLCEDGELIHGLAGIDSNNSARFKSYIKGVELRLPIQ